MARSHRAVRLDHDIVLSKAADGKQSGRSQRGYREH